MPQGFRQARRLVNTVGVANSIERLKVEAEDVASDVQSGDETRKEVEQ